MDKGLSRLRLLFSDHFEWMAWVMALVLLGSSDPTIEHYSLCGFKFLGLDKCPGCGLGHAIAYLFRGQILYSFQCHLLGIPVVFVLLTRIYQLLNNLFARKNFSHFKKINNEIKNS